MSRGSPTASTARDPVSLNNTAEYGGVCPSTRLATNEQVMCTVEVRQREVLVWRRPESPILVLRVVFQRFLNRKNLAAALQEFVEKLGNGFTAKVRDAACLRITGLKRNPKF